MYLPASAAGELFEGHSHMRWTESTQPLEVRRDPIELLESRRLEEWFVMEME